MIKFMDLNVFVKNLKPVTSMEMFTRSGDYHTEGLFSEIIFGPEESQERRSTYSYIDLKFNVIHPTALTILYRLDRKIEKMLSTEMNFSVINGAFVEDPEGVTGISNFIEMFPKINFRGETPARDKFIKLIKSAYESNKLFISKVPVIPPEYRPAYIDESGQRVIDELNNIYINLMRRSTQLKTSGSGPLHDLLRYGLQQAMLDHDSYIRSRIEKKSGLIRSQLLGKRTDFSGRAVITPGPQLRVNEIGVPLRLAVSLFEPFLLHILLYSGKDKSELNAEIKKFLNVDVSVDAVQKVIKAIKNEDKLPDKLYKIFYDATEMAMKNRVVLAKRDPVLHTLSYKAYHPVLIEGSTIQLGTTHTGGHNADFDGDQMALYHPITDEAQLEAKTKMMKSLGSNTGEVTFGLSKEMYVGFYTMTKPIKSTKSPVVLREEDVDKVNDPFFPVIFRGHRTTSGRAVFNHCLPKNYPFIDQHVKKKMINSIISDLVKKYPTPVVEESVTRLEQTGFKFATIVAPSITLDQMQMPKEIYDIKNKLKTATVEEAVVLLAKAETIMKKHLENTGLYDLAESGSTKGWDQPKQILVAKGIIADPTGKVLDPISGSFADGFTNTEFFNASSGARKGIIDRVLNTADTGYMSRKLAYVLNTVEADLYLKDCGVKSYLNVKLDKDLLTRMYGRYHLFGSKVIEFNPNDVRIGQTVHMRTPIFCQSEKICHTCYGRLLEAHKSPYVGILASQVIGERGTQMIMKSFHTGGAIKIIDKDILKDILDNDPLIKLNETTIKNYVEQINNVISTKKPCKIFLDLYHYTKGDNFEIINDRLIKVSSLMCKVEYDDIIFNISLDYPVEIHAEQMTTVPKEYIELDFGANTPMLTIPMEAQEIKQQVLYVERMLGGKEIFKDVDHLYRKLFRIYGPLSSGMDSVHLEILLSNVLRDKKNLTKPARLGKPFDPVMINIKKIVFNSGFIQGLSFENIGEAIRTGLVSEEDLPPSIIEKVLTGTLVESKKKK